VDTQRLLHHIKTSDDVMKMFDGWMQNRASTFTIDYDDLFGANGNLSDTTVSGIRRITGLQNLETLRPEFVKTANNDLSKAIANYDEVSTVLAKTPYAWMLD